METKKTNIITLFLVMIMCAVSIFVCVSNKDSGVDISDDMLSMHKKIESLEKQIKESQGKSAYDIAVDEGFSGSEGEWLLSLNGKDGENALTPISIRNIYDAYLIETNQTEQNFSYDEFLIYYYSVVKYDAKTATQLAYSTTVDICYTFTNYTHYVQQGTEVSSGKTAYKVIESGSGEKGGVAAGAGVIYQMLDSDSNGSLDTAYIITNYHVAYVEAYSNDENYELYYCQTTSSYFLGTMYGELRGNDKYFLEEDIEILSTDEGISKHFLNGFNDEYYGVYLYGYQDADYKLNATFVGGSADNDIAVLKIDRSNISTRLAEIFFDSGYYDDATIGNSLNLVGGEEVVAVGNPLIPNTYSGMTLEQYEQAYLDAMVLSSTSGVVSTISNDAAFESIIDASKVVNMRLIRVDAAINSGNSGGGLYDLYGNLIGIVNSKMASSNIDNVGYAIPINVAAAIANQVINQCDGSSKSSLNTRVKVLKPSNLGFEIENGESKSSLETDSHGNPIWKVSSNIIVSKLQDFGLAQECGLELGDIVTELSFGGNTYAASEYFNQDYELNDLLLTVNIFDTVLTIKVLRAGNQETISINLTSDSFVEIC